MADDLWNNHGPDPGNTFGNNSPEPVENSEDSLCPDLTNRQTYPTFD
jgi:hypothetical protein